MRRLPPRCANCETVLDYTEVRCGNVKYLKVKPCPKCIERVHDKGYDDRVNDEMSMAMLFGRKCTAARRRQYEQWRKVGKETVENLLLLEQGLHLFTEELTVIRGPHRMHGLWINYNKATGILDIGPVPYTVFKEDEP